MRVLVFKYILCVVIQGVAIVIIAIPAIIVLGFIEYRKVCRGVINGLDIEYEERVRVIVNQDYADGKIDDTK